MSKKYGKKLLVEAIGTAMLTAVACGVAYAAGGTIAVSLAFGLVITLLCYTIGPISGGHFNPAISVAKFINGEINGEECLLYILAQVIGGIVGSLVLGLITVQFSALGANDISIILRDSNFELTPLSYVGASFVEIFLTCIFTFAVLYATGKNSKTGKASGLFVGGALTLVHLLGYNITGTSVNPARSFGPAVVQMLGGNMEAAKFLPVFIFAPIIGAILAAFAYKYFTADEASEDKKSYPFIKYVFVGLIAMGVLVAFLGFMGEYLVLSYNTGGTLLIANGLEITFGVGGNGINYYEPSIGNIISFAMIIITFVLLAAAAMVGFAKKDSTAKKLLLAGSISAIISGILLVIASTLSNFSDDLGDASDYVETLTNNARFVYVIMFIVAIVGFVIFKFIKVEKPEKVEAKAEEAPALEEATDDAQVEETPVEEETKAEEETAEESVTEDASTDEQEEIKENE